MNSKRPRKKRRFCNVLALSSLQIGATCEPAGARKRLRLVDESVYSDFVDGLVLGGCYTVTIEEEVDHDPKTWEQIKYWFAVPVPLVMEHTGMTDQQASHALLGECFGYIRAFGKDIPKEPSVAALSKSKMTHLIDWVLDWLPAELEIVCPPPDKDWRLHAERIRKDRRSHA
jgi:hypothetical protein